MTEINNLFNEIKATIELSFKNISVEYQKITDSVYSKDCGCKI